MSPMLVKAAAVLSAVLARLEYLLSNLNEHDLLRQRFEQLLSKLSIIQQFLLSETGNPQNLNLVTQEFCKKVILLAHDVENAAESHAMHMAALISKERSSQRYEISKNIFSGCLRSCSDRGTCLDDLDNFIEVTNTIIPLCGYYKVIQNAATTEGPDERVDEPNGDRGGASRSFSSLRSMSHPLELDTRGFIIEKRDEKEKLVSMLLADSGADNNSSRIAIVGEAGSGKTTLANQVFKDTVVVRNFNHRAWVFVGETFQARDVLEKILVSISPSHKEEDIENMSTIDLMEMLYRTQNYRRCLIVLDEVWSTEAWEALRFAFLKSTTTKILMTTHKKDVALHFQGSIHEIRPLTHEESWELFIKYSGLVGPFTPDDQKTLAEQSKGVPISIVMIARVIRINKQSEVDKIEQLQNNPQASQLLDIGYNDLSLHEKLCLLYLSQFPLDQTIRAENLYLMWIAEGLISKKDLENRDIMDVAEEYLLHLVDGGFVSLKDEGTTSIRRVQSCQLHGLFRDLCLSKGREEEFFTVVGRDKLKSTTTRGVVHLTSSGCLAKEETPDAKMIRSLLFFDAKKLRWDLMWPKNLKDLKQFQWMRVLHFDGIDLVHHCLPQNIDKLVYLRYLGFADCILEVFPLSSCNCPYLETLYLRVKTRYTAMTIPNHLGKLINLRHLYLPEEFKIETGDVKLKMDTLTKLETLENFHTGMCEAEDLRKFKNLRVFTVTADGNTKDFKEIVDFIIEGNEHLRHSSVTFKEFDCYSKARRLLLNDMLSKCDALRVLHLEGRIKRVPKHLKNAVNLVEVVFEGTEFREDPMPELGLLPNLRSLALCNDAFEGTKISCPISSFTKLQSFKISNLQYLEEWEQPAAMPSLSFLTIEGCNRLPGLPRTLMKVLVTLRDLKVSSMPQVFHDNVEKMMSEELEGYLTTLSVADQFQNHSLSIQSSQKNINYA